MNNKRLLKGRPAIFGEVLFDHFPDGSAVLGGAPFNVAWHLQGFGHAPLLVSRVGGDEPGHRVKRAMQDWGLDTSGLQTDAQHPTGTVEVKFEGAQHSFHILPNQAYDHIDAELAHQAVAATELALLYHGSLVVRTPPVRQALDRLLAAGNMPVFLDVNLRDPWWSGDTLSALMEHTRWVKLNDEELNHVAKRLGLRTENIDETARSVHAHYHLDLLILTLGAQGAIALDSSLELIRVEPDENVEVIDTVGAGDAFAAVMLLGLLETWPIQIAMKRAQNFASRICAQRGATSPDLEMYRQFTRSWTEESNSDQTPT